MLLPTVLNHYPMYIGDVYIAPISTVFYVIWKLLQLILDEVWFVSSAGSFVYVHVCSVALTWWTRILVCVCVCVYVRVITMSSHISVVVAT